MQTLSLFLFLSIFSFLFPPHFLHHNKWPGLKRCTSNGGCRQNLVIKESAAPLFQIKFPSFLSLFIYFFFLFVAVWRASCFYSSSSSLSPSSSFLRLSQSFILSFWDGRIGETWNGSIKIPRVNLIGFPTDFPGLFTRTLFEKLQRFNRERRLR